MTSTTHMLALVEQHNPYAPGAVLKHRRPWPAYSVALVVAAIDDDLKASTTAEDIHRILKMELSTARGHLEILAKAGFLRRDDDGGYIPAWVS